MSDGSLEETIGLLSPSSSALLLEQSDEIARLVVIHLGEIIRFWETSHVTLDPIQREVVLDSVCATLVAVHVTLSGVITQLSAALQAVLAGITNGAELPAG